MLANANADAGGPLDELDGLREGLWSINKRRGHEWEF